MSSISKTKKSLSNQKDDNTPFLSLDITDVCFHCCDVDCWAGVCDTSAPPLLPSVSSADILGGTDNSVLPTTLSSLGAGEVTVSTPSSLPPAKVSSPAGVAIASKASSSYGGGNSRGLVSPCREQ